MSLKLTYETFFELNVLHHFYLNNGEELYDNLTDQEKFRIQNKYSVHDFLSITPTAQTQALLASNQLIYKSTNKGLICGTKYSLENDLKKPVVMPDENLCLSFKVNLNDGLFYNYTSLPFKAPTGYSYYFTNDASVSKRLFPSLTALYAVFKSGTEYYPGDMLVNNAANPTKLFIAQKRNSTSPTVAAITAGLWKQDALVDGKPLSYAGSNDLMRRFGNLFIYEATEEGKIPLLSIEDRKGNLIPLITQVETGKYNKVKTELNNLPEGLYTAKITTADASYADKFFFYRSVDLSAWAFIDICIKTGDAAYNLLTGDDVLKSPVFTIRFKNRFTFWRYIGKAFGPNSVSEAMLPLTKQGFITVKVKDKNDVLTTNDLPNPSPQMIKPESDQIFSEIYM